MGKILIEKSGIFTEISGGSQDTPQQLLNKILIVDGKGSGLDADLLGGVNYSQYALKKDYYDRNIINTQLSNKLNISDYNTDKATFALKSDSYTKSEVNSKYQDLMTSTNEALTNNVSEVNKKIADLATKSEVDNKLNNYVPRSLFVKQIAPTAEFVNTFYFSYELQRKEQNKLEVALPRYIENYDLKNNFIFLKMFSRDYKCGARELNHNESLNLDGKNYYSIIGQDTSSGPIFPYSEEFIEDKKYTEYLYQLLIAENHEYVTAHPDVTDNKEILKNYYKKIVRVKVQQTNIFNKDDNTITIKIELKPLEEYTKDFEYQYNENATREGEFYLIDFSKLDKNAFREIQGDPDFKIDSYGNIFRDNASYFAIVANDIKEIFDDKIENNQRKIQYYFKLDIPNSTSFYAELSYNKDTTLIKSENNAKLRDILKKYSDPDDFAIYNDCVEVTTTPNFDANYEIYDQEITTDKLVFFIKNKTDETIRFLEFNKRTDSNIQNNANFLDINIRYDVRVSNPFKSENYRYMYSYLKTNEYNFDLIEIQNTSNPFRLQYNLDLYPKVVIKSFYVAKLVSKEQEELNSLIDSKNFISNNYNKAVNLNAGLKVKGNLQKDNSAIGKPDEDYITSKYYGENFPIQFMTQMSMISGGSVNNLVLKNQSYTSPAYTFTDKTNIVSLGITDLNKQFNNFVLTFTDTPNKLIIDTPAIGQSGLIKVIGAKKINGYDEKIKSTITLPVLDKLNDTEYFSYYVFSESEILVSRI